VTVVAGRYRLVERLGRGGMGVVWRAHDELLRRDVAVKELHVRLGVDDDFQTRQVLREARAAARLRHPGVVAVHDVIVDDGRPLIVMELVEGRSLAELIRTEGPLPEQRVAEIGVHILASLSAAHQQGVVHRDVKPANILLDGDRVVLTDFGIAAVTSDTTVAESAAGSPEYLAPERINGEPATPAADLWSLGVTLCAALRGESPFQRSDTQATLAAVLTYDPAPIRSATRLWPVLETLLRKDPRQRPDAGAALVAIAGAADLPLDAVTRPVVEPRTTPRVRHRLVALIAVLVLVVAGGIWLAVSNLADRTDTSDDASTDAAPTTVAAPPGFTGHQGDGFTLAVPNGWFEDASDRGIYWDSDPHSLDNVVVHVEWWDEGHPEGAHGVLSEFERGELTMDFITNYKRIRLEKVSSPAGTTSAELEATFHVSVDGDQFDSHELMRAFVTAGGRSYVLTLAAESGSPAETERLWRAEQDVLTTVLDSFRVTS
jgi:serine/threonine protein kinase